MRLTALFIALVACKATLVTAEIQRFRPASTYDTDRLATLAMCNVRDSQSERAQSSTEKSTCRFDNAIVRREWTRFTSTEKRRYISAVLCLMRRPSISGSLAPGAHSRFDDFLATHINQTLSIHGTGSFLSWHRYFTWTYERALRHECDYTGHQPYLNWPRYALDLYNAPVFDGSPTSMSGNGGPDPRNNGTNIPSNTQPDVVLPAGRGGGCVTSGPFANLTINLGPVSPSLNYIPPNPQQNSLGHNPRCLRRDMSAYAAARWTTDRNITDLILNSPNISTFQNTLQGNFPAGYLGAHSAGHFFVGGDPGGDIYTSPGDPYFYLHHAQVDRVWWIWQNLPTDPEERRRRRYEIAGTMTVNDDPPSRDAALDDVIELGVNTPQGGVRIGDAVDTLGGTPFCYVYM